MGVMDFLKSLLAHRPDDRNISAYRSVLFVCHANITRSPSAEGMFREFARQSGQDWRVASAGVAAQRGTGAHPIVQLILRQRGIGINTHRSQPVTRSLIARYRWILVMEESHRQALLVRFPDAAEKIFLLRGFGKEGEGGDMPDPTGKEVNDYAELFAILDGEIPRVFHELEQRVDELLWRDEDE